MTAFRSNLTVEIRGTILTSDWLQDGWSGIGNRNTTMSSPWRSPAVPLEHLLDCLFKEHTKVTDKSYAGIVQELKRSLSQASIPVGGCMRHCKPLRAITDSLSKVEAKEALSDKVLELTYGVSKAKTIDPDLCEDLCA
jgi:hypothetical protein